MKLIVKLLFLFSLPIALAGLTQETAHAGHHGECGNIVETAADAGQFETLLAAATAAGLAPALSDDGPFTVFAPTDEAFGTLPAGTVETLLKPENKDRLANILKFHVVSGRVGSDALEDGATLDTLAGPRVTFTATEQGFSIEGARIVATDIDASNGIVHVIDRVILPPETMNESMSREDAARSIDRAIARGVPMFNHGNPTGTVRVYDNAVRAVLASAPLSTSERNRLERALRASDHSGSARDSAWQLRYAMDDVRESLRRSSDMVASAASMRR
ncbi:fasciclin domain-containing protein [Halomonas denitrificans]|nr:fasciclin domain-containing protein [Halomonas denitrificans]